VINPIERLISRGVIWHDGDKLRFTPDCLLEFLRGVPKGSLPEWIDTSDQGEMIILFVLAASGWAEAEQEIERRSEFW